MTASALLLALVVGCGAPDVRAPGANVVLISVDTWRADHLTLYGYERETSPTLQRLATDSVVFDRAFSASPHTAPSHMSMLTGVPPLAHGIMNINTSPTVRTLPASIRTLAEMLKAHGYRTAAFTGAGNVRTDFGFPRGFDSFVQDSAVGMHGNRHRSLDPTAVLKWLNDTGVRAEPFFLFLHTYIPHAPYLPPPPYDTRYDPAYRGPIPSNRDAFFAQLDKTADFGKIDALFWKHVDRKNPDDVRHLVALYDGECNAADDAVATFVRAIDEAALGARTIFIVTSDHGELFGEHDQFIHPGELWDELIHVPLIVRTPGTLGRGRRVGAQVSALDLVPTVLDLAGLPADPQPFGRSLAPLMEGAREASERVVVSEFLVTAEPAGSGFEPRRWLRSVRTSHHKFIRRGGFLLGDLLFALDSDPGEARNVVGEPAYVPIRDRLRTTSDAIERAEAVLRAPSPERRLSDETLEQLRALGYVE